MGGLISFFSNLFAFYFVLEDDLLITYLIRIDLIL